jgi:hypothetical protein
MTAVQNDLGLRLAASLNGVDQRDVDTWARVVAGRPITSLLDLTDDEARRVSEQIARAAGGVLPPRNGERPTTFPDVGYPPDYRIPQGDEVAS